MCVKGPQCPFAHGGPELRALPDLRNTKLCRELLQSGECKTKGCSYAHTREELRSSCADKSGSSRQLRARREARKADVGKDGIDGAEAQQVLASWKDAAMPSPPGLSGWEGASGSGSTLRLEADVDLVDWFSAAQASGSAGLSGPYPMGSAFASSSTGLATLPGAVPPGPVSRLAGDIGQLAVGATGKSRAAFGRTVEPAYVPLWPEDTSVAGGSSACAGLGSDGGSRDFAPSTILLGAVGSGLLSAAGSTDSPATPLSRGGNFGGLGGAGAAVGSRGTPFGKSALGATPSGATPLTSSTLQDLSPESGGTDSEDREWEETYAGGGFRATNGFDPGLAVDGWNTWDSWSGWGGWGGWNGLGTGSIAEGGLGGALLGNVHIDQQDDMWQPGSVFCASVADASAPRMPMKAVRTSESTLCTLSDERL